MWFYLSNYQSNNIVPKDDKKTETYKVNIDQSNEKTLRSE